MKCGFQPDAARDAGKSPNSDQRGIPEASRRRRWKLDRVTHAAQGDHEPEPRLDEDTRVVEGEESEEEVEEKGGPVWELEVSEKEEPCLEEVRRGRMHQSVVEGAGMAEEWSDEIVKIPEAEEACEHSAILHETSLDSAMWAQTGQLKADGNHAQRKKQVCTGYPGGSCTHKHDVHTMWAQDGGFLTEPSCTGSTAGNSNHFCQNCWRGAAPAAEVSELTANAA